VCVEGSTIAKEKKSLLLGKTERFWGAEVIWVTMKFSLYSDNLRVDKHLSIHQVDFRCQKRWSN